MLCWKCGQCETELGQPWCAGCRTPPPVPVPPLRRAAASYTVLYFCAVCGAEVYRHPHVRRRTKKLLATMRVESRLAVIHHAQRVGHTRAAISGELVINEAGGDDAFEVANEGAASDKTPRHMQASTVLAALGWLPAVLGEPAPPGDGEAG